MRRPIGVGCIALTLLTGACAGQGDTTESAASAWTTKALEGEEELFVEDGARIATRDWLSRSTQRRELLYVTCVEPDLADGPPQDRSATPPPGVISYSQVAWDGGLASRVPARVHTPPPQRHSPGSGRSAG